MHKQRSIIFSSLESLLYLGVILIYPFLFIRFGLDYSDSAYHYLAYTGGRISGLYTYMDAILGHLLMSISSDSFISFRAWAAGLNIVMHLVPVLFISRLKLSFKEKLRYVAICLILSTAISFNMLSWETFSGVILSVIFVVGFNYAQKQNWISLVFLGALTAFIASVRFPSVVVCFPLILMIFFKEFTESKRMGKAFLRSFVYLLVFIGVYLLLWQMFGGSTGSAEAVVRGNSDVSNAVRPAVSMSKSLKRVASIIPKYLTHGFMILELMSVMAVFCAIWRKSEHLLKPVIRYLIAFGFIALYMLFNILFTSYNLNLSLFYSSLLLLGISFLVSRAIQMKDYGTILVFSFAALLSFTSAIGSDTGLLKLAYSCTFILPVVLSAVRGYFKREERKAIDLIMGIIVLFSVANTALGKTYEDRRIFRLNASIDHPKLRGIRTTQIRKKQVEELVKDVAEIRSREGNDIGLVFYSTGSHLFTYLTDTKQPYTQPYSMSYDNSYQAERMADYVQNAVSKPYIVLVYNYAESRVGMNNDVVTDKLISIDYKPVKEGLNYMIYAPKDKSDLAISLQPHENAK